MGSESREEEYVSKHSRRQQNGQDSHHTRKQAELDVGKD
ncbi:hypothetical protein OROGR_014537 [Orobanche gracilis]